MKRGLMLVFSIVVIGILTACGSSNSTEGTNVPNGTVDKTDATTADAEKNTVNENGSTDSATTGEESGMDGQMKKIDFAEFSLEVEYDNNKEYEAEIEKSSTGAYKSQVEDELTNTYLKGEEAFNHLYPIVEKINVQADSTKEEVVEKVLKAFNLDSTYKDIDIEIIFHDGKRIKYEND